MLTKRRIGAATWLAAVGVSACLVAPTAIASDEGQAAADQVSQLSLIDYMDAWLYTHLGDDRGVGGPEHDPCRDNIAAFFTSYGMDVALEPFTYSGGTYHNVVGTKIGTVFPDEEIVIGAHYDSVSNPGADDDASGVALVLEAARIITQYDSERTIRFCCFSREEQGLIGSEAYVDAHIGDNIIAMLEADMVAYDTETELARIYSRGGWLMNSLGAAIIEYSGGLSWMDAGWISASDHASFDAAGYDACLLIESEVWNNPYYHTPLDAFETPGNLDWDYMTKMTRSSVGWLVDQAGVLVEYDGLDFQYPDGRPELIAPSGGTTMRVVVAGVGEAVPQPGTGMLHYDVGAGWQSVAMDVVADNVYDAVFPAAECGSIVAYYTSAEAVGGEVFTNPRYAPDQHYTALAAYGREVFWAQDMSANPGWTTEGLWAWGQPTGGGGQYGYPDPTSGYTGDNVYGYNLNGDYENNLPERHLTSTAIDCTGQSSVALRFWRYLGVEQPTWDHAYIRVSNNGVSWTTIWENSATITDDDWVQVEYDISAIADDEPTVYLRWTMGTTDSGWQYCGWNIDDIELVALVCDAPCPEDVNGDQVVNVLDLLAVIAAWGNPGGPEDIDGNGIVDVLDLLAVIAAWGPC